MVARAGSPPRSDVIAGALAPAPIGRASAANGTRSPIVFVGDRSIRWTPASSPALRRPGGNVTGITSVRHGVGGEAAGAAASRSLPRVTRAAGSFAIQPVREAGIGRRSNAELRGAVVGREAPRHGRSARERRAGIEAAVRQRSLREPNGGADRDDKRVDTNCSIATMIATSAAQHTAARESTATARLRQRRRPDVYGTDVSVDQLIAEAAVYVDRILKGEKPADLPVAGSRPSSSWSSTSRPRRRSASTVPPHAARPRRRGDRMSAPGKAGAIQPVEVRLK